MGWHQETFIWETGERKLVFLISLFSKNIHNMGISWKMIGSFESQEYTNIYSILGRRRYCRLLNV